MYQIKGAITVKKLISLTIVTVMLLASLCSCNGKTPSDNDGNTALEIYTDILTLYENMIMHKHSGNKVSEFDMSRYEDVSDDIKKALIFVLENNHPQTLGYALKDINSDSHPELILLNYSYDILALFTTVNAKPILVDTFGMGNVVGAIDQNGTIYKESYSKGETWSQHVMTLTASGELEGLRYGCIDYNGYFDEPQKVEYYLYISDDRYKITKQNLGVLSDKYSSIFSDTANTTKNSGLKLEYVIEFDPK